MMVGCHYQNCVVWWKCKRVFVLACLNYNSSGCTSVRGAGVVYPALVEDGESTIGRHVYLTSRPVGSDLSHYAGIQWQAHSPVVRMRVRRRSPFQFDDGYSDKVATCVFWPETNQGE